MWRVEHRAIRISYHWKANWVPIPVISAPDSPSSELTPGCYRKLQRHRDCSFGTPGDMTLLQRWDSLSLEGSEKKSKREGKRNRKREQKERSVEETEHPASVDSCLQGIAGALPSSRDMLLPSQGTSGVTVNGWV